MKGTVGFPPLSIPGHEVGSGTLLQYPLPTVMGNLLAGLQTMAPTVSHRDLQHSKKGKLWVKINCKFYVLTQLYNNVSITINYQKFRKSQQNARSSHIN